MSAIDTKVRCTRRGGAALVAMVVLASSSLAACGSGDAPRTVRSDDSTVVTFTTAPSADSAADPGNGEAPTGVTAPEPTTTGVTIITLDERLGFTPDPATTTSALISATTGGTLVATAADGTVFTLAVPPDALAADTRVTATAAAIVSGITGAGALHAVNFQPEGLQFIGSAALRIQPVAPVDNAHILPFQAAGDGTDLRVGILDGHPDSTTILVDHFSTTGIAIIDAVIDEITVRSPARNTEAQLWNDIATNVAIRSEYVREGKSTAEIDLVLQILFNKYQEQVITPLIEGSDGSCAATLAVAHATRHYYDSWLRNSLPSSIVSMKLVAQTAFLTMEAACEKERIKQCQEAPDHTILSNFWKEMRKWRSGLGLPPNPNHPASLDEKNAQNICESYSYFITGGLEDFQVVSQLVCDIRKPFTLDSPGVATAVFSGSDTLTGTYTAEGVFNLSYSGTYTIALPDGPGKPGTMSASSAGSIAGQSGSGTEQYTLAPASADACP